MQPVQALLEVAAYPDDGICAISYTFWHRLSRRLSSGFESQEDQQVRCSRVQAALSSACASVSKHGVHMLLLSSFRANAMVALHAHCRRTTCMARSASSTASRPALQEQLIPFIVLNHKSLLALPDTLQQPQAGMQPYLLRRVHLDTCGSWLLRVRAQSLLAERQFCAEPRLTCAPTSCIPAGHTTAARRLHVLAFQV